METIIDRIKALKSYINWVWPTFDWSKKLINILLEIESEASGNSSIARTWKSKVAFETEASPMTSDAALEKYGLTVTILNEMVDQKYDYIKSGDSCIYTITYRKLGTTPSIGCSYTNTDTSTSQVLDLSLTADGKISIYVD